MLENLKISLWDFFNYIIIGALILVLLHLTIESSMVELIKMPDVATPLIYLLLTYILGTVFEPIANFIFGQLKNRIYRKFGFLKNQIFKEVEKLKHEQNNILAPVATSLLHENYDLTRKGVKIYQFAKSVVIMNKAQCDFSIFLSKYGYYRNLSIISLFLTVVFFVKSISSYSITFVLAAFLFVLLHLLFYRRAKQFYYYSGNEVFKSFILLETKKKTE